jgi:preprotein translocase subunit SecB
MSQAVLQFKDYYVVETQYKTDPFYSRMPDEKIVPSFSFDISPCQENPNSAYIELGIEIGDSTLMDSAYYVYARILGYFSLLGDISDPKEIASYFRINAVAILYPYLRALVSDLTSRGSESPIILPTMNIQKMMAELEEKRNQRETEETQPNVEVENPSE